MAKVAIVTGGGSGLGRATAIAFAKKDVRVVVADISTQSAEETVHLVHQFGGEAIPVRADVSRAADVEDLVNITIKAYRQLDYAFNNAGIALQGRPVGAFSEDDWDRTIAINLKGVFLCLKYECAYFAQRNSGGAVVNTSSAMGTISAPGLAAYSASKAGVIGLTKAVALDYAKQGVRVNAICPGGIANTAITSRIEYRGVMQQMAESTPMGRMGEPDEVAGLVMWLCSDSASYLTGQAIVVDGGLSTW